MIKIMKSNEIYPKIKFLSKALIQESVKEERYTIYASHDYYPEGGMKDYKNSRSRNTISTYKNYIKANDDGSGVAADGCRLHYVKHLHLYPGYYRVVRNTKRFIVIEKMDIGIEYPPWKKVIELPERYSLLEYNLDKIQYHGIVADIVRNMEEYAINCDYVKDAVDNVNTDKGMFVYVPEDDGYAIVFKTENYFAAVMPIRP